jgi:hypothetical protein
MRFSVWAKLADEYAVKYWQWADPLYDVGQAYKAYQDGVIIEARDIVFEHLHPIFGKAEWDETYARSNSDKNFANGKATYEKLIAQK